MLLVKTKEKRIRKTELSEKQKTNNKNKKKTQIKEVLNVT